MPIIFAILAIIVALGAGAGAGYIYRKNIQERKIGRTEEYARNLLDDAQRRAEEKKKESILEAKEEVIRLKNELDREVRDRRSEVQRSERRLTQREEQLDKKADALDARESSLEHKQEDLEKLTAEELMLIDGIGEVLANDYVAYFSNEHNISEYHALLEELNISLPKAVDSSSGIAGKTFVITGAVHIWKNRNELKDYIEANGGKTASAVSSKTDYLINNDVTSGSSKNKKAKELGIPIITEEEFRDMV